MVGAASGDRGRVAARSSSRSCSDGAFPARADRRQAGGATYPRFIRKFDLFFSSQRLQLH